MIRGGSARAGALLVVAILGVGCASPDLPPSPFPTSTSPAMTTPAATPASPPFAIAEHDLGAVGDPEEKLPFAFDDWIPADYLAFDPDRYDVHARVMHGTRVVVAIHEDVAAMREIGGSPTRPPEEVAAFFFEAFDAAWHVFGGYPYDEARVVVRGPDEACDFVTATQVGFPICYQEHAHEPADASRPPHPATQARIPELFTHELFHMWNGGVIRAPAQDTSGFVEETWWVEGATTYYAAQLARDGYDRAMRAEVAKYERLLPEAGGLSFAELASRTSRPGDDAPNAFADMLYTRGALVARLLDEELAKHGKDLDDVARVLYLEALAGKRPTSADVEAAAERVTGADLGAFFDAYVRGAERVPTADA